MNICHREILSTTTQNNFNKNVHVNLKVSNKQLSIIDLWVYTIQFKKGFENKGQTHNYCLEQLNQSVQLLSVTLHIQFIHWLT